MEVVRREAWSAIIRWIELARSVAPLSAVLQRRGGNRRPSWAVPAVVSWAGTRGVVPLAAALSIPLTTASGAPLAQRDLILVLATAVIVVSFIVQGLTLEPLARFTGIARPADARHEETVARLRLAEAALARLDELTAEHAAPDATIGRVRASLQARIGRTRARIDGSHGPEPDGSAHVRVIMCTVLPEAHGFGRRVGLTRSAR